MNPGRLLIRLGSLGDVVLATAAANAARESWGDRCLDVLVKEEWAPLWENHPAVDRVWSWSRRDRNLAGLRAWRIRLAQAGYADVFDLQSSPRTRWLTRGLGRVHRPRRLHLRRRLMVAFKKWGPPPDFHVARTFVDAVNPRSQAEPSLHPGEEPRKRARVLVPENRVRVGLVPGARHATKRWPLERFVETGRALAAGTGPVPVFFGGDETELLQACRRLWPAKDEWFPVREDLPSTLACLARLRAVVTNDTGLMHMAAAVDTPVVALFGPTVPAFGFSPRGERHQVLEVPGLACRPCSLHGGERCPRGHFRCMKDLPTDRVTEALAGLRAEGMIGPRITAS